MIARSAFHTTTVTSDGLAGAEAWETALEKVTLQANALSESFEQLRQRFEAPTPPSPPTPEAAGDLAQRVAVTARQIQSNPSQAAIHESLASALELMNEIAAQAASQNEVRQIAAQVETLRQTVNNISSRARVDRLP